MNIKDFLSLIDFNSDSGISWAELELKSIIHGFSDNKILCRYMIALTWLWNDMAKTVTEGILSSQFWNCFNNDISLISDIYELYAKVPRKKENLPDGNIKYIADNIYKEARNLQLKPKCLSPILTYEVRKYMLFNAVERRFPLLLIKYYVANAKRIHKEDEQFAIWLKQKIYERSKESELFSKIYKCMMIDFKNNHLTTSVFMK